MDRSRQLRRFARRLTRPLGPLSPLCPLAAKKRFLKIEILAEKQQTDIRHQQPPGAVSALPLLYSGGTEFFDDICRRRRSWTMSGYCHDPP